MTNAPATPMETQFFARLTPEGDLIDGDGVNVGVAFSSTAWPGSLMVCLDTALVAAMRKATSE